MGRLNFQGMRRRGVALLGVALTAVLVIGASGCASTSKPELPQDCRAENPTGTKLPDHCKWIRLTPLSSVASGFTDPNENFSNFYTRVLITSRNTRDNKTSKENLANLTKGVGADAGNDEFDALDGKVTEAYGYRDRGWLLREIWGTHYGMNMTAYVSVGAFQATVPLITIDHTSNRNDGEKFQRIVVHTIQNFPLFLLKGDGSNAIATVHFVVKATDTTQSSAAAAAIQVAQGIAEVVAPESAVLTTLSSSATKEKAAALDKAINSVLSRQLDEEQWLDNDVRRWGAGARVTFKIPPVERESDWGSSELQRVGAWVVSFEDPRPSVFSDIQLCRPYVISAMRDAQKAGAALQPSTSTPADADKTTYCRTDAGTAAQAAEQETARRPEQVLNFNLVNGSQSLGTVNSYLRQQAWWDPTFKTFNALTDKQTPKDDDVAQFCRSIKQSIATVGLNAIDGGIVVAALRDRGPLPKVVVDAMTSERATDCQYAVALQAAAAPKKDPDAKKT